MTTVALATRIPLKLKKALDVACKKNGLKINYFVEMAIRNKLISLLNEQIAILKASNKPTAEFDSILRKLMAY